MLTPKTKKTTRKRIRQLSDEPKSTVVIPYVQDLSESVSRVYKRHGIATAMRPFQSIRSLLVHFKDWHGPQDICECVYKIPCKNCNKTYIGETGRTFGVRLQEHRQEVSQREVRAYTRSTSRSLAGEQNKSAVTDHAISLNHVIDWDQAKVINRKGNRVDTWIKKAIHIRKEQDKSMNRNERSDILSHIYDNLFAQKLSGERRLDRPFQRRLQSRPKRQQ